MDDTPTFGDHAIPVVERPLLSKTVLIFGVVIFASRFIVSLVTVIAAGLMANGLNGIDPLIWIVSTGLSYVTLSVDLIAVVYSVCIIDDLRRVGIGKRWMHAIFIGLAILTPVIGIASRAIPALLMAFGGTFVQLTRVTTACGTIQNMGSWLQIAGTIGVAIFMIRYLIRGAYRMFAIAGILLVDMIIYFLFPSDMDGFTLFFFFSIVGLICGTLVSILRISILLDLTKRGRSIRVESTPAV